MPMVKGHPMVVLCFFPSLANDVDGDDFSVGNGFYDLMHLTRSGNDDGTGSPAPAYPLSNHLDLRQPLFFAELFLPGRLRFGFLVHTSLPPELLCSQWSACIRPVSPKPCSQQSLLGRTKRLLHPRPQSWRSAEHFPLDFWAEQVRHSNLIRLFLTLSFRV